MTVLSSECPTKQEFPDSQCLPSHNFVSLPSPTMLIRFEITEVQKFTSKILVFIAQ